MIKILILSVGTNACFHFVKTLKNNFKNDFFIIGTDINDKHLVASSIYIDKFYKVPYSNDPLYYDKIINICIENNIQYLLPSLDIDQLLFFSENEDLINNNIISFGSSFSTLNVYKNKTTMYNFLKENSFPLPNMYQPYECDNNTDYIIKPIDGYGSSGVQIVNGKTIKEMNNIDKYIIQDICLSPEITVEYFQYNGFFSHICRERIATKAGVCTKARVFQNEELCEIGHKFSNVLKLPYFFNMQFMVHNNKYVITDVNLRMAGGVSIASKFNWDYIKALANIMLGNADIQPYFPTIHNDNYVIRMYDDVVTNVCDVNNDVIAFDLDGTLIDSRNRHHIVLKDILKSYNLSINVDDLVDYKRNGKNNVDYLLSKGIDIDLAKEIQNQWVKIIENIEYIETDVLYDDAINLLQKYSNNKKIAITARQNKANLIYELHKLGILSYFDDVFIVNPADTPRLNKEHYLKNCNVSIYYGDTILDYKAAVNCNIKFIHRDNGFHSFDYIKKSGF